MRNVFMASVAAMAIGSAAFAEETTTTSAAIGGSIGLEVTENAAGNMVAETTLGASINVDGLAFGSVSVESVDGGSFELDSWSIGTVVGPATLSFGDQGDLMVGNDFEIVGGDTLADVADDHESLQASVGDATVMVGLTDVKEDITEVENVQGSYTLNLGELAVTAVGDYNIDAEDFTLGGEAGLNLTDDIALGGLVTYDNAAESFGYEASAGYGFATVFANGDDTDMLQNVGGGVNTELGGLNLYAEGSYNIDAEDTTLGAGIALNF